MVHSFNGLYTYSNATIDSWNNTRIGVYYIGILNPNNRSSLFPYYIGKGTSDKGMRGRLLDHLNNNDYPDATHFGYCACDTVAEADNYEVTEIHRYRPKYNTQHA